MLMASLGRPAANVGVCSFLRKWSSAPDLRRPLRLTKPLHRCLCLQSVKWLPGHESHVHLRFQRPLPCC